MSTICTVKTVVNDGAQSRLLMVILHFWYRSDSTSESRTCIYRNYESESRYMCTNNYSNIERSRKVGL